MFQTNWFQVRLDIEREYWRNVEENLSVDDMSFRVGELADCLQRDAEFTMRAVGGDWYFHDRSSKLKGSRKTLAVNPRVAAVESAARRLLPQNVEWELFECVDGTADVVITRMRPQEPEVDRFADYRNFF